MCIVVGGLALAEVRELVSRLLGRSLREFRTKMNLSQEKLAEKLHVNTRNYQKLERGVHKPSAITIILFLYLLSDQEIISFIRSSGQMVEKADSREVA